MMNLGDGNPLGSLEEGRRSLQDGAAPTNWRQRSIGSMRRSSSRSIMSQMSAASIDKPVIHLADLGKRHTNESRAVDKEKLRKAVLKSHNLPREHSQQASMDSSKPSSDSHTPLWLSKDQWVTQINTIDADMLQLEKQYKSGELRAFGRDAAATFRQLDELRRKQQELFHNHIDLEKEVINALGHEVPEVDRMESEGFAPFGNEEASQTTHELLSEMTALAKEIQATVFDNSGVATSHPPSAQTSPTKAAKAAKAAAVAAAASPPLTRAALDQLPG